MKVVEIGGSLTTTLSNNTHKFYLKILQYCKQKNTNIIPTKNLTHTQMLMLEELVRHRLVDYDWEKYTLIEVK